MRYWNHFSRFSVRCRLHKGTFTSFTWHIFVSCVCAIFCHFWCFLSQNSLVQISYTIATTRKWTHTRTHRHTETDLIQLVRCYFCSRYTLPSLLWQHNTETSMDCRPYRVKVTINYCDAHKHMNSFVLDSLWQLELGNSFSLSLLCECVRAKGNKIVFSALCHCTFSVSITLSTPRRACLPKVNCKKAKDTQKGLNVP